MVHGDSKRGPQGDDGKRSLSNLKQKILEHFFVFLAVLTFCFFVRFLQEVKYLWTKHEEIWSWKFKREDVNIYLLAYNDMSQYNLILLGVIHIWRPLGERRGGGLRQKWHVIRRRRWWVASVLDVQSFFFY